MRADQVERARTRDIPDLVELMHEFYAEAHYPLDRKWAADSFARLFANELRGGAWIARDGADAAGYVVLTLTHSMEYGAAAGFIDDLFVRERFRRRGVGSALLGALFGSCRALGVAAVHVEVGWDNAPATALYRAFGLSDNGRRLLTVRGDAAGPIRLEEFRADHAGELVRMWRESFELGVGVRDPHPLEEQERYLLEVVAPANAMRVAMLDGRMVGFVAASPASISQLYVRTGFHRRGIGSRLLEWAKGQSHGSLWLYTFERNTGARAFYERHGFRIVARGHEPHWDLDDLRYEWVSAGEE